MNHTSAKTVAVLIPVDDTNWRSLPLNPADLRRQRDIQPHVVVLDRTESGVGEIEGVSVVPVGAGGIPRGRHSCRPATDACGVHRAQYSGSSESADDSLGSERTSH